MRGSTWPDTVTFACLFCARGAGAREQVKLSAGRRGAGRGSGALLLGAGLVGALLSQTEPAGALLGRLEWSRGKNR